MPEKLKNLFFTKSFISELGFAIQNVYPQFDRNSFEKRIYDNNWSQIELKEKMRHISTCLYHTLPSSYPEALDILLTSAPAFKGFDAMIFPDFVECYGLEYWDISLDALAVFTKCCSSEFAIRPFIIKDPKRAMQQLNKWAHDQNVHVRRLASEGCRPRLPWAGDIPGFKKDPQPIIPVLETLKNDVSEYVRRSVANNLNDISKDHPDLVLKICEKWQGANKETDWIIKHACRGLLKKGNTRALILFDFNDPENIQIKNFEPNPSKLHIGGDLFFSADVIVPEGNDKKLRLEYAVDYKKANSKLSRKIFQIKEGYFKSGTHHVRKKQSFVDFSTRKHYPGDHYLSFIVNGVEKARLTVTLLEKA